MLRRTAALLGLAAAVLVLSGCRLWLDVEVTVDRDGGGTLVLTMGADEELLDRAEDAGADPLTDLLAATGDLRGWRVTDREDLQEGGREVALTARFDDPDELSALTAELTAALAAPEVTLLEPMHVAVTGDEVRFVGAAGLVPTRHVEELGLLPEDAVQLARDQEAVAYSVEAVLPGPVLSSNADELEGRVARWHIPPGERVELHATAERPPRRLVPLVVGGLLGGVAAAAVVWLARRRLRRRPAPT